MRGANPRDVIQRDLGVRVILDVLGWEGESRQPL